MRLLEENIALKSVITGSEMMTLSKSLMELTAPWNVEDCVTPIRLLLPIQFVNGLTGEMQITQHDVGY